MRIPKLLLLIALSAAGCLTPDRSSGQDVVDDDGMYTLARTDLRKFAEQVAGADNTEFEKASNIVTWFAENFDWTATDYKRRSVQEILERRGGNCNELAMVTLASLDSLGLRMRKIREINLHREDAGRQARAARKVEDSGPRMSVFGRFHNDHVWIEILDEESDTWFPADPSLGIVGEEIWLRSRLGFGERFSLDPGSADMIAPFALFATFDDGAVAESRTRHYLIEGFDELYERRLSKLEAWTEWSRLLDLLDHAAARAFDGTLNLHDHESEIAALSSAYASLRQQYVDRYGTLSPPE